MKKKLLNWLPRPRPEPIKLEGSYVSLEPLRANLHGDELFEAATVHDAQSRFRWLAEEAPSSRRGFSSWLNMAENSTDPLYFAVRDLSTGKIAGRQTFMRIDERHGVIEIGNIYWSPMIARRQASTEAFFLFAAYVFDQLGYRRLEWKCDNLNLPSKSAAQRFGMKPEGVFRQHMVVKNQNRDTAWFSLIDSEWPAARQAFEAWLDPQNFDAQGMQIRQLREFQNG